MSVMLDAGAAARSARDTMIARGEQWTSMRAKLFGVLAASDRPVSAYDAAEILTGLECRRIAVATVYRMLALFVAQRIVSRIESINAYVVSPSLGRANEGLFLICDRCGKVEHAENESFHVDVETAAISAGFASRRLIAEVHGFCSGCMC